MPTIMKPWAVDIVFVLEMNPAPSRSVGEDSELDDPNLYPIPNFNFRAQSGKCMHSRPVSQRICSGPRIWFANLVREFVPPEYGSAGIYLLVDLFQISRKSANLFRMGNGR